MIVSIPDALANYISDILRKDVAVMHYTAESAISTDKTDRVARAAMRRLKIARRASTIWDNAVKDAVDKSENT